MRTSASQTKVAHRRASGLETSIEPTHQAVSRTVAACHSLKSRLDYYGSVGLMNALYLHLPAATDRLVNMPTIDRVRYVLDGRCTYHEQVNDFAQAHRVYDP